MSTVIGLKDRVVSMAHDAKATAQGWLDKIGIDSTVLLNVGFVFAIGIAVGFFLKRYFSQLLFLLLIVAMVLFVLQHFSYIDINWLAVKSNISVKPTDTVGYVVGIAIEWIKEKIIYVVSFVIGFIIGHRIG